MRKLILLLGLVLLSTNQASAQDYPKGEVFGGFSYANVDINGDREGLYGWQASRSGNFHRNVGFTADFGGQYKSINLGVIGGVNLVSLDIQTYEFLFWPRFTARSERVTGFGHTPVGFALARASLLGVSDSETGFALGFGGGVDVNASDRVVIRIFQVDYIPTRFSGVWSTKDFRIGVGVVYKWP